MGVAITDADLQVGSDTLELIKSVLLADAENLMITDEEVIQVDGVNVTWIAYEFGSGTTSKNQYYLYNENGELSAITFINLNPGGFVPRVAILC